MQRIERTYRCRLSAKLVTRLNNCVARFNSSKIGKHRRHSLLLVTYHWSRGWYGTERLDLLTIVWDVHSSYLQIMGKKRRERYYCSDHGLLVKKIIESLPRRLRLL